MMSIPLTFIITGSTICSLMFSSCASQSSDSGIDFSATSRSVSVPENGIEREIFIQVNKERVKRGLDRVNYHRDLSGLSRGHSDFMAKNKGKFTLRKNKGVSSATHFGSSARSKMAQSKYHVGPLTENVHVTHEVDKYTASDVVIDWMNSAGHRRALLGKTFMHCGIGVRLKDGSAYTTLVMAGRSFNGGLPKFIGPRFGW